MRKRAAAALASWAWLGSLGVGCGGWVDLEPLGGSRSTTDGSDAAGEDSGSLGDESSSTGGSGRGLGASGVDASAQAGAADTAGEMGSAGAAVSSAGGGSGEGGDFSAGGDGVAGSSDQPLAAPFKILVLSTALEFVHDSIPHCQRMLTELGETPDAALPPGAQRGSQFSVEIAGDDLADFTDQNLSRFAMLFWCNPTGRVFTANPAAGDKTVAMAAFQRFMARGGAWGGVHSATDFEKTGAFPWFTNVIAGAYFNSHDNDGTAGTIIVEPGFATHAVMRGVPPTWATQDEWYYMNRDVAAQPGFQILARLSSDQRPVVWIKELEAGARTFYTVRGHHESVYAEPDFRRLVLNGVLWATHRLD